MDSGLAALLGVATGFILTSAAAVFRYLMNGRHYKAAIGAEIAEAKRQVNGKMRWILRNEVTVPRDSKRDPCHQVSWRSRLLYLGEPETFTVQLPLWEQHITTIVELMPTKAFAELRSQVSLINQYVVKFRDMKMAFTCGLGNPEWMAVACLEELIKLHDELIPERAPVLALMETQEQKLTASVQLG